VQRVRLEAAPLVDALAACWISGKSSSGDDALFRYAELQRGHAVAMVRICAHFGACCEFQEALEAVVLEMAEAEIPSSSDLFGNLLSTSSLVALAMEDAAEAGLFAATGVALQAVYRQVLRVEDAVRVVLRCLRAAELHRGSSRGRAPLPPSRIGSLSSSGGGTPRAGTAARLGSFSSSGGGTPRDAPESPRGAPLNRPSSALWLQRKGSDGLQRLRSGSFSKRERPEEPPGVAEVREQVAEQAEFLVEPGGGVCGAGPREILVLCFKTVLDTRHWALKRLFEPLSLDPLAPRAELGAIPLQVAAQVVVKLERTFLQLRVQVMLNRTEGLLNDDEMQELEDKTQKRKDIGAVVVQQFKELAEREQEAKREKKAAALTSVAAAAYAGAAAGDAARVIRADQGDAGEKGGMILRSFTEVLNSKDFGEGLAPAPGGA
jgi:hypothetical protein